MTNIVVVFPRVEEAKKLKNLLVRNGHSVAAVCTTAAQAIHCADGLVNGIMVSAYKLPDMMYSELREYLPDGFEMIVLASRNHLTECSNVASVTMPFAIRDFLNTLEMVSQTVLYRKRRKRQEIPKRSEEEQQILESAKAVLMEQKCFTEAQAHQYIQKKSMESGNGLVETAQMLLAIQNAKR